MRHVDEPAASSTGLARSHAARGTNGFFRTAPDAEGRWWLLDQEGSRFFFRGVHGVCVADAQRDGELPPDTTGRLRTWGFNAVGVTRDTSVLDDGLPFLAAAGFCNTVPALVAPRLRLPDVFDPRWPELALARAKVRCAPLSDCRALIGWVTDDQLEWATPSAAGRPSLLQLCLSLEPSFAAYHAAWEFVLAHHGGCLEQVAHAWSARLPNKEFVRELTRAEEGLGTRGYLRDEARWTREFARRYFSTAAAAVRQADPNHLVLGCQFRRSAGAAVLAECVYPAIDVSMPHWTELPSFVSNTAHPVLADYVSWTAAEFLRPLVEGRTPRLTTLERALRKARTMLDRTARHPGVVGYAWAQWQDEPGEQPPFAGGLVHLNGVEAREHTELLQQFNHRAETLHRAAR